MEGASQSMKHESIHPSLMQDSLSELKVICAIACRVGEADSPAGHAVSSRFAETSQKKKSTKTGTKIGDHERSKSLTRYTNTDTVLQCMVLGSNALYRPFVFFRSCLSIDSYTDQRGHAITMNTIQGCRPRPLELQLHILFCLSSTMTQKHLNRESSEHMQDAGELMEWLLLPSCTYCTYKAAGSSETPAAVYQTARCNIPESSNLPS
jgi:hypothetical protein